MKMLGRVLLWNALPNGRHAYFYNLWAGRAINKAAFRRRLRRDLTAVFEEMGAGRLVSQVAAELPLTSAAEAVRLAESGTVTGKVILTGE
jgi:NADPH:quinone reductase-like Zn-dependent oxidoreductase